MRRPCPLRRGPSAALFHRQRYAKACATWLQRQPAALLLPYAWCIMGSAGPCRWRGAGSATVSEKVVAGPVIAAEICMLVDVARPRMAGLIIYNVQSMWPIAPADRLVAIVFDCHFGLFGSVSDARRRCRHYANVATLRLVLPCVRLVLPVVLINVCDGLGGCFR